MLGQGEGAWIALLAAARDKRIAGIVSIDAPSTTGAELMLEELNDARANPAAYGAAIGLDLSNVAPSQPLAFNSGLIQAAEQHAQDMSVRAYFGHVSPDGQALGILQLDTSDRRQFLQDDLDVLAAVASQAAIAVQNAAMHESLLERERIERDLKLAEQVQKRFLPQSVPAPPGFEFFAHYNPAFEIEGMVFALFVIVLAAAEAAIALAIVLNFYNNHMTVDVDTAEELKG